MTKKLFYKDQFWGEINEHDERRIEEARKAKQPQITINGETIFTRRIEILCTAEKEDRRTLKKKTTEDIKKELGHWSEEYLQHCVGNKQYECDLLFGERLGIVKWLVSQGIISKSTAQYRGANFNYWMIKNLQEWKSFCEKLELHRELKSRDLVKK